MATRRRASAAVGGDQDELQRLIRDQQLEQQRDARGVPLPARLSPSSGGEEHYDYNNDESDAADDEKTEVEKIIEEAKAPVARARRDENVDAKTIFDKKGRVIPQPRRTKKVREERALADYGTARAAQQERERTLFHCHFTRLTIIDPVVATIAAMRWSRARRLTVAEIAELTGRATTTVEQDLQATRSRLVLLGLFPPPDPASTYRPARDAGLSARAAGFAFWLSYTVSAERAAELTGYGRAGAADARKSVIRQLAKAGKNDDRLVKWSASLDAMPRKLQELRQRSVEERQKKRPGRTKKRNGVKTSQASTTLGKRRNGLQPTVAPGEMPKPIPWLDEIDDDVPDVAVDFDMIRWRAMVRHVCLDGDPVEILADMLEHESAHVIELALMLAQRNAPYFDTFRDEGA